MSYDYALDKNGDISYTQPNVEGLAKAKQQILSMIRTGKGGWPHDPTIGHLWADFVSGTLPHDYVSFFQSLTGEIEKIEYVKKADITNYEIDDDKNTLIIYLDITLEDGKQLNLKGNFGLSD